MQTKNPRYSNSDKDKTSRKVGPCLMVSVAAFLILLRVWATTLDGVLFRSQEYQKNFECKTANAAINILAASFSNTVHVSVVDYIRRNVLMSNAQLCKCVSVTFK